MTPDQLQRLSDLTEKLADAFLLEADPSEWSGAGKSPADLTKEERGNRYWCKKNAMGTGGVLRYALDLIGKHPPGSDPEGDADLEKKVDEAERRARAAVDRAMDKARKRFTDRAIGKP